MKKVTKIVVNGQEYDGIDQMPSELRQQYLEMMGKLGGDADGDGVPDDLQRLGASNVFVKESITFNGKTYNSRDELPPDVRELLDHMPKPKPGEDKTSVEVKTTRVFEPRVSVSSSWMRGDRDQPTSLTARLSWFLVLVLLAAVIVLVFLWLSGIKPSQLLPQ